MDEVPQRISVETGTYRGVTELFAECRTERGFDLFSLNDRQLKF
jgi:hypothetical protein